MDAEGQAVPLSKIAVFAEGNCSRFIAMLGEAPYSWRQ
jgi:hypothetical protein